MVGIAASCDAAYTVSPSAPSDAGVVSDSSVSDGDSGASSDDAGISVDASTDAPVDALAMGCVAAQPGLVAYYPFDDDAGTIGHDCSGYARDGVIANGTWGAGKHGNALVLGGSGCMDLGADAGFLQSGPFTIAMWVNLTTLGLNYYVAKTSMPPQTVGWHFGTNAASMSASVKFGTAGGPVQSNAPTPLPTSTWVHVALRFDPSVRAELWVSGALASGLMPAPAAISDDPSAHLRVGCGEGIDYVVGAIDDVRFYNRALSAAEIAALAQ